MVTATENERQQKQKHDDLWVLLLALLDDDEPQQVWAEYVPAAFAGLLDGDGFTWDAQTQTYRSDSGTTVNANAVQRIILSASHGLEIDIERKLQSAGADGLDTWGDESLDELLAMYLASAAAGVGGIDNLDDDSKTSAYRAAKAMRESIDSIVAGLQDGTISQAQAVNRAGMNAQQANGVFQDARRVSHMNAADENGEALYTQERNVLTETAMHCSECPELTEKGWVPIGTLPPPGSRQCAMNCKCSIDYRLAPK